MNKSKSWLYKSQTLTLLFIMFIDGVGMSLVLPLIADLFSNGDYSLLNSTAPTWLNQFYYGASLAAFSIAMIFGASVLGQFSDKHGRKLTLTLSLIGAVIGYLICALAVVIKAPMLFISGRVIDGLTAGSIPVAQAILSDLDTQSNKMTSIGKVMFAVTSGYMLGPVIAGTAFMGQSHNHYLPFVLVAISCLACIALISFIKESRPAQANKEQFKLFDAFKPVYALFKVTSLRSTLLSFFLFQCAWTLFYQYLPKIPLAGVFLNHTDLNVLMAAVGAAMCFGFCIAVPKLQEKLTPVNLISLCFGLFTVFNFTFLTPSSNYVVFTGIAICMALLYAVGYSAMLGFLLNIADDSEKGLILGSVASICALSATATAVLGGYLNALNQSLFFGTLLLMSLMALLLFFSAIRKQELETV